MSTIFPRGNAAVESNLTPMIDVTFLLIVFFVLVSQIVEVENVDLALPELEEPISSRPGDEQRAVINVVPGPNGQAAEYRLGAQIVPVGADASAVLADALTQLLRSNPTLRVNLRADQHTQYEWVQPVLQAVSLAASGLDDGRVSPRVNLVIIREEGR